MGELVEEQREQMEPKPKPEEAVRVAEEQKKKDEGIARKSMKRARYVSCRDLFVSGLQLADVILSTVTRSLLPTTRTKRTRLNQPNLKIFRTQRSVPKHLQRPPQPQQQQQHNKQTQKRPAPPPAKQRRPQSSRRNLTTPALFPDPRSKQSDHPRSHQHSSRDQQVPSNQLSLPSRKQLVIHVQSVGSRQRRISPLQKANLKVEVAKRATPPPVPRSLVSPQRVRRPRRLLRRRRLQVSRQRRLGLAGGRRRQARRQGR